MAVSATGTALFPSRRDRTRNQGQSMVTREQTIPLLMEALREILATVEDVDAAAATADTPLVGEGSPMDSIHLVQFVLESEERLASDLGVEVSLTDERAFSRSASPFRSVRSLADYVAEISPEHDD